MKKDSDPILITGLVRFGTSWTGEMVSFADNVCQLFEPFHPDHSKVFGSKEIKYHFIYDGRNDLSMKSYVQGLLKTNYFILNEVFSIREMKDLFRIVFRYLPSKIKCNIFSNKVLIKDPYSFFLAEWLAEKYQFSNVILIRHPGAFVESFTRNKSWDRCTICDSLLAQKEMMHKYDLKEFEGELIRFSAMEREVKKTHSEGFTDKKLRLERASLIWNIFAKTYLYYKSNHDWIFLKYEDLAANPTDSFKKVYYSLGLSFTKEHENKIKKYCSSGNKVKSDKFVDLRRDSKSLINLWEKNMTEDDTILIKELTKKYGRLIYEHKF